MYNITTKGWQQQSRLSQTQESDEAQNIPVCRAYFDPGLLNSTNSAPAYEKHYEFEAEPGSLIVATNKGNLRQMHSLLFDNQQKYIYIINDYH